MYLMEAVYDTRSRVIKEDQPVKRFYAREAVITRSRKQGQAKKPNEPAFAQHQARSPSFTVTGSTKVL